MRIPSPGPITVTPFPRPAGAVRLARGAIAVLAFAALAGCAVAPPPGASPQAAAPSSPAPSAMPMTMPMPKPPVDIAPPSRRPGDTATDAALLLPGYRWRLETATSSAGRPAPRLATRADRPVYLVFEPITGRIAVSGGCNRMGGSYTLGPGGLLGVSQWMGTRMACAPALMQLDAALGAFLGAPVRLAIENGASGAVPRLVLTGADQTRLVFAGEPTAETRYGGTPEIVFLEVAPQRVACAHPLMPKAACLQVRERRYDANGVLAGAPGAWQPLYGEIEGFTPTDGMRQVLRVKRFQRPQPLPADQSSTALVLDMVIESERAPR